MDSLNIDEILSSAVRLHNAGSLEEASILYAKVLEYDKLNFYALNYQGCIERSRKNFHNALILLSKAIEVNPHSFEAYYNLGNVHKDCEHWEEAAQCFYKSISIDQSFFQSFNNLSVCLKELKLFNQAIQAIKQAIALRSTDSNLWLNLGNILCDSGEYEEAIQSFQSAIDLREDFAEAHFAMGNAYRALDDFTAALACYEKTRSILPSHIGACLNAGLTYRELGDFNLAISCYTLCSVLDPDLPDSYLNLGNLNRDLGRIDDSKSAYIQASQTTLGSSFALLSLATLIHEESLVLDAVNLYKKVNSIDKFAPYCNFHLLSANCLDVSKTIQKVCDFVEACSQSISDQASCQFLLRDSLITFCTLVIEYFNVSGKIFLPPLSTDYVLKFGDMKVVDDLEKLYKYCRSACYPRWLQFLDVDWRQLLLADYAEYLRVTNGEKSLQYLNCRKYHLASFGKNASASSAMFCPFNIGNEEEWLISEQLQFPESSSALSLVSSYRPNICQDNISLTDQSEFYRKGHLLDAQKYYMSLNDPCIHGVSELFRVHELIVDVIHDIDGLDAIVDFGYYSGGFFRVGLSPQYRRYCVEPSRHHALWIHNTQAASVLPFVPPSCVTTFDEYLDLINKVQVENDVSTMSVISFLLQLFDYSQCVHILKRVRQFSRKLLIVDDVFNVSFQCSVVRLTEDQVRMQLCHNYANLLSDSGWTPVGQRYFNGVRYANGFILAEAC